MRRGVIFRVRLSEGESDLLTVAARCAGRSRSDLLRHLLQRASVAGELGMVPPQSEPKQAGVQG